MAAQRNKEIGIRKVLGASMAGITGMQSRNFVRLVLIAFLIASPIAWWAKNKWLEGYQEQYRITIGWWMFAAAAGLVILIALTTVSFQAIRAAMANPMNSLRTE